MSEIHELKLLCNNLHTHPHKRKENCGKVCNYWLPSLYLLVYHICCSQSFALTLSKYSHHHPATNNLSYYPFFTHHILILLHTLQKNGGCGSKNVLFEPSPHNGPEPFLSTGNLMLSPLTFILSNSLVFLFSLVDKLINPPLRLWHSSPRNSTRRICKKALWVAWAALKRAPFLILIFNHCYTLNRPCKYTIHIVEARPLAYFPRRVAQALIMPKKQESFALKWDFTKPKKKEKKKRKTKKKEIRWHFWRPCWRIGATSKWQW